MSDLDALYSPEQSVSLYKSEPEQISNAEEEKSFTDIKSEYEALVSKMESNKKDALSKHKAEIKEYLEEESL